jgi:hypothetical protein
VRTSIAPVPSPEEAAAILVALAALREPQQPASAPSTRWRDAARTEDPFERPLPR